MYGSINFNIVLFITLFASVCTAVINRNVEPPPIDSNDTPIIGILAQEISYHLDSKFPGEFKSFIAASYVKFVEGGGARVIPIWIDRPKQYYRNVLSKVNGVLFPGGATYFNQSNGYADAGRYIYEIAMEMNDRGYFMPIFGTCLGMELLFVISTPNGKDNRVDCWSQRQALPLNFVKGYKDSDLFGSAPEDIINILATESVTPNFHQFCVTRQSLIDSQLDNVWKILSVNDDENGLEFVSSFEHFKYPFYGVQFHPEKNIYEWIENRNIPHTANAIRSAQYFAQFFIDQTRKSDNRFNSKDEETRMLIYNYPTNYTALVKSAYEQCYLFDENADYRFPKELKQSGLRDNADW